MVHCAKERTAGLIIVTRDSDFGVTLEKQSYINDALRQEFSERVSRKRQLRLCSRLSDALRLFDVKVTAQEEATESELLSNRTLDVISLLDRDSIAKSLYQNFANYPSIIAVDSSAGSATGIRGVNVFGSAANALYERAFGGPSVIILADNPGIPPSEPGETDTAKSGAEEAGERRK